MTCPYCGGDGTVTVMVNDGTLYYEDRMACPHCHGDEPYEWDGDDADYDDWDDDWSDEDDWQDEDETR